jgi:uncharacterized repeat protein (TIGR01451 family)
LLLGLGLCAVALLTAWVLPLKDNSDAAFLGQKSSEYSGNRLAMVGDVNGDGYDDMLIGAYNARMDTVYTGGAYLVLGRPAADWGAAFDLLGADASFAGEASGDLAGGDVAGAGDVNGDGYADLLIGAYGHNASDVLSDTGKVYLILGRRSADWGQGFDLANADASFLGENGRDYAGFALDGVGDVNHDGYDDFIVGAYTNDQNGDQTGKMYLFLGRPTADWGRNMSLGAADASFVGEMPGDWAGYALAGAGDVNGDGYDDMLIGAYGNDQAASGAGKAYLLLGRANPNWGQAFNLRGADACFLGETYYDNSADAVSGAGDVNRDGLDDLLIGARSNDEQGDRAGQVYLILGKAAADWGTQFSLSHADASFGGERPQDNAGCSLAGAGDANRDGYADFLIGAHHYDPTSTLTDTGRAYLVLGKPAGWHMDTSLTEAQSSPGILAFDGEALDDHVGTDVAGGGDVNGDRFPDLIVGAPSNDEHQPGAGKTYLILGRGLVIRKTADTSSVAPGGCITYTVSYSNTTTRGVQGVRIGDVVPSGTTFAGCSGGITCTLQNRVVVWQMGTLSPGAGGAVHLRLQVAPDVPVGTVITNTAWITAPSRVNPVFSSATARVTATHTTLYLPLALDANLRQTELAYDSGAGTPDASWEAGKGFAVRFTPPSTPATVTRARFYFYAPLAPVDVCLWDANHTSLMTPLRASPTAEGWYEVDLSAHLIAVTGDFYVGYLHAVAYTPTLGADQSAPDGRSYEVDGLYWQQQVGKDYMIRATVCY